MIRKYRIDMEEENCDIAYQEDSSESASEEDAPDGDPQDDMATSEDEVDVLINPRTCLQNDRTV
jgi:U3 small nucleolar RNA-associated protein 14